MSLVSWWVANNEEFELAIMNDERSSAENIEKVDALLNTVCMGFWRTYQKAAHI
jgi:hypothetical protein